MDTQHNDLPFPVASIEFAKVYMVRDRRIFLGYSDRELSFLLGYRPLYVRDVEDPLHTLRYTPKDTNYLMSIFDCSLAELMPAKVADLFYQVKVGCFLDDKGNKIYEISREKDKQFVPYRVVVEDQPGILPQKDAAEQVRGYITQLFMNGYFDDPRTSLEIFKKCTRKFGKTLRPQFVMDGLSFYTSKRKSPKLVLLKNMSARTVYVKQS